MSSYVPTSSFHPERQSKTIELDVVSHQLRFTKGPDFSWKEDSTIPTILIEYIDIPRCLRITRIPALRTTLLATWLFLVDDQEYCDCHMLPHEYPIPSIYLLPYIPS